MQITSTYSVRIKYYSRIFTATVLLYRKAVDFFIGVILCEWQEFAGLTRRNAEIAVTEHLCVQNKRNPSPKYNFTVQFYKFPSYLRRAAIAEAYGKVCSYQSNLARWQASDPRTRGTAPSRPKAGFVYPAMYRDNCYVRNIRLVTASV